MPKYHDKVLTSLAGEYYVAAELCRRGFMASLTLKNYPKVDIFALDPVTQKQMAVQVKSVRRQKSWGIFVPADAASYSGVFVFVIIGDSPSPAYEVFVATGQQVSDLSEKARNDFLAIHPNAKPDQPLMLSESELSPYRDNWHLFLSDSVPTDDLP